MRCHPCEGDMTLEDNHQFSRASLLELLDLGQSLVLDLRGHILHWTTGCQQLYGYTAQEAAGQLSHQLLRTRFPQPLAQIRETLERTGRWAGELLHQCRNGRFLTVASLWALHRDATGSRSPSSRPTTTSPASNMRKRATGERGAFRGTFESAAVGITQIDPEGRWLRVNPKLCQTLGYTEQELIGQRFIDFTYPDDREEDLRSMDG